MSLENSTRKKGWWLRIFTTVPPRLKVIGCQVEAGMESKRRQKKAGIDNRSVCGRSGALKSHELSRNIPFDSSNQVRHPKKEVAGIAKFKIKLVESPLKFFFVDNDNGTGSSPHCRYLLDSLRRCGSLTWDLAIRRSHQSALAILGSFNGRLSFTTTASHVTVFAFTQAPSPSRLHWKDQTKT